MLSLMSTGSGLLFGGDVNGHFRAYDQKTGEVLWDINLGAAVNGYPITYSVGGKQYIAVSTGGSGLAFGLGAPRAGAAPGQRQPAVRVRAAVNATSENARSQSSRGSVTNKNAAIRGERYHAIDAVSRFGGHDLRHSHDFGLDGRPRVRPERDRRRSRSASTSRRSRRNSAGLASTSSFAFTIVAYMIVAMSPLQGFLVDRFGPRRVVLTSIPLLATRIRRGLRSADESLRNDNLENVHSVSCAVFVYFSFVIGMTSQVSDVAIVSKTMRLTAAAHGMVSFVFNAALLALTVNMAASAI